MSKSLEEIAIEESDFLTHITKPIRNFVYIDSDQSLIDMFQKIDAKMKFMPSMLSEHLVSNTLIVPIFYKSRPKIQIYI